MSVRLIATDEELMIVLQALLSEYRERTMAGKAVIFPPWKFVLPEEKIEIKGKEKFLVKKKGEKVINFSFEGEEADVDAEESLRMLGVTLYHLVTGKSELTHESFLLDGYRRSFNSTLWPIILILLRREERDVDKIKEMIKAIDPKEMKAEIEPPKTKPSAGAGKTKSAEDIIRALAGEKIRVVNHAGAVNFWGVTVPQDVRIRYSEATLREAIAANQNGEQWMLAYYSGLSLRQMRDRKGVDQSNQPCFWDNNWWLRGGEDSWANKNLEPGYYLLNFAGKFANEKWADQERLTSALGPVYERAHETIVTETAISNFGLNGGERLMNNWYHWGKEADSDGLRVCVGRFDSRGWGVFYCSPGGSVGNIRVVVFRKFDF